jgi:hypothetical protein
VVRLEKFVGRIPGTSCGDMLVFGTKIQEKKVVLLFGELDLKTVKELETEWGEQL